VTKTLEEFIKKAEIGKKEELEALKRLSWFKSGAGKSLPR
jgi:hypothetical protein